MMGEMENSTRHEEFVSLFARHQRRIAAYIGTLLPNTCDAEEVMQETSIVLWRKWHEFDASRDFVRWANGIAYREVLRFLREQARTKTHFSEELLAQIAEEHERQSPVHDARYAALAACLGKLKDTDRQLINQRYATEATAAQIAATFNRPVKSVYRSLERIRAQLMECVRRAIAVGDNA